MGHEKMLDIVFLIVFLAFATTILSFYSRSLSKSLSFSVENKSVIDTKNSLYVGETIKTGEDLLMSLAQVDNFVMYPRAIRINNTPVIELTDEWIMNKASNVAKIYDAAGVYKLSTMLSYKIESVTYVETDNGGYLQYRLVP